MELICHINASESECTKGAERGKRIENRGRKAKKRKTTDIIFVWKAGLPQFEIKSIFLLNFHFS